MWWQQLFFSGGVASSILVMAIAIALGILLGKIKIGGVSLGITWILFVGIALSHFGMQVDKHLLHFVKEFGLILFVYSIGLQVGPSFFSSLKKGGLSLNMLAVSIVFLGVLTTLIIHWVTGTSLVTMVGVLSGAITNTPGLGAAQAAYADATGQGSPLIAQAYAVAYPLGVVGIILSMVILRGLFRVDLPALRKQMEQRKMGSEKASDRYTVVVENPAIFGKSVETLSREIAHPFVVSRRWSQAGGEEIAQAESLLQKDDKLLIITSKAYADAVCSHFGRTEEVASDFWELHNKSLVSRRLTVTRPEINGRDLAELNIRHAFGVNVTRFHRAGVDLTAQPHQRLLLGDRLTVVGSEHAVNLVEKLFGNAVHQLRHPNLIPIFVGIALGVLLGSIPLALPGLSQPVKLGLAGGPLVVAILISYFGPKYKIVTYTTVSANMMLRELGISLFLAAVGIEAGGSFVQTLVSGGYIWILYGFLITVLPLLIVGAIGYGLMKIDFLSLMGMLAGSTTDPPALAYANSVAENDMPAVGYASVYPLTMFLRVLTAQLLILFAI
jgi:Predicted permease